MVENIQDTPGVKQILSQLKSLKIDYFYPPKLTYSISSTIDLWITNSLNT